MDVQCKRCGGLNTRALLERSEVIRHSSVDPLSREHADGSRVIAHGAWILLALTTWRQGGVNAATDLMAQSMHAIVWPGGIDADGHGNETHLLAVWGKLSLVVYACNAVCRWIIG